MNAKAPTESIGFSIKCLDHLLIHTIDALCDKHQVDQLAVSHSMVIHYLAHRDATPTYQRDLEKAFHLTRSAITNIVQILERENYIKRESVPGDARLKRIILLERGFEFENKMKCCFRELEDILSQTLTAQEREQFLSICHKLEHTLEPYAKDSGRRPAAS